MNQKKVTLICLLLPVILLLAVTAAGCGREDAETGTETAGMAQVSLKVHTETLRDDDGAVLLDLEITYPEITIPGNNIAAAAINDYYKIELDRYVTAALSEGLDIARTDKESAESGGYEFYPHAYACTPQIYYNGNNLLSVQNTLYFNTGGAHPNSFWRSETFDLTTGNNLALTDIFGCSREDVFAKVYEAALAQIEAVEGTGEFYYFDNYRENLRDYYGEDDFYLTGKGFVFYYQLYTLAPYAAGFPVFELSYDQAGALEISIPELTE